METTAEHHQDDAAGHPPATNPEETPSKAEADASHQSSKELPPEPTEAERALEAEAEALQHELKALENKIEEKRALRVKLDDREAKYKELLESHEVIAERVDVAESQRAELEFIVAKFGDLNLVEKRIDSIEETVAADSLQHVWNDTVAQDDISAVNIPSLQVRSLRERATAALTQHEASVHRANELMMKVEQEKSLADATLADQQRNLTDAFEAEKKELLQTRAQLKALETEQQFHIRRGTYIKDPPPQQVRDMDLEKQVDLHNQMCAELVEERERLESLADDVRALRKDEDVERERANTQVAEMNERIKEAKSIAEEMEWEREVLLIEKEELAAVKKDLVAVTAAVKQQRKH